jgi:hypothetical protein
MKNLTHYQRRVLDKILPPLKKTEPYTELLRVCLLFRKIKEIEDDPVLFDPFKTIINNNLYFHLKSKEEFYDLERFKDVYKILVEEFIEDNIDADEKDFVEKYINSQLKIIDKIFKYYIKIDGYESLEITQFVQKDFFEEFIRSSKKKIEFLNNLSSEKLNAKVISYENPYPEYFISYGYEIYKEFTQYFREVKIVLAPQSFLIDQLIKDDLINKDKTLISIFNFLEEEFDTNFGTANKFKSDFSRKRYLPIYKLIKKRYDIIPK